MAEEFVTHDVYYTFEILDRKLYDIFSSYSIPASLLSPTMKKMKEGAIRTLPWPIKGPYHGMSMEVQLLSIGKKRISDQWDASDQPAFKMNDSERITAYYSLHGSRIFTFYFYGNKPYGTEYFGIPEYSLVDDDVILSLNEGYKGTIVWPIEDEYLGQTMDVSLVKIGSHLTDEERARFEATLQPALQPPVQLAVQPVKIPIKITLRRLALGAFAIKKNEDSTVPPRPTPPTDEDIDIVSDAEVDINGVAEDQNDVPTEHPIHLDDTLQRQGKNVKVENSTIPPRPTPPTTPDDGGENINNMGFNENTDEMNGVGEDDRELPSVPLPPLHFEVTLQQQGEIPTVKKDDGPKPDSMVLLRLTPPIEEDENSATMDEIVDIADGHFIVGDDDQRDTPMDMSKHVSEDSEKSLPNPSGGGPSESSTSSKKKGRKAGKGKKAGNGRKGKKAAKGKTPPKKQTPQEFKNKRFADQVARNFNDGYKNLAKYAKKRDELFEVKLMNYYISRKKKVNYSFLESEAAHKHDELAQSDSTLQHRPANADDDVAVDDNDTCVQDMQKAVKRKANLELFEAKRRRPHEPQLAPVVPDELIDHGYARPHLEVTKDRIFNSMARLYKTPY